LADGISVVRVVYLHDCFRAEGNGRGGAVRLLSTQANLRAPGGRHTDNGHLLDVTAGRLIRRIDRERSRSGAE
jgi:hypothetical protein